MSPDQSARWGLNPVVLSDRARFEAAFASCRTPVSDYSFSQVYCWTSSMSLYWKEIAGCLCVFANGFGDLTLLLPPLGQGDASAAMSGAFEIMHQHNAPLGLSTQSRMEYVTPEMATRLDLTGFDAAHQCHDYVYETARMIDLAGGDLKSKRQARNRFQRDFKFRTEIYSPSTHAAACKQLLANWHDHQDGTHEGEVGSATMKRNSESKACERALDAAADLGLVGTVVYVEIDGAESIRGFTLGESLGSDQASILIEKTDLEIDGLAQFIFSEFCRTAWVDKAFINAGDDWGLPSLAWTKQSYRPAKLLPKLTITRTAVQMQIAKAS